MKDSFENLVPDYVHNENYKQGLPISKSFDRNMTIYKLCQDIINEDSFKDYFWNAKKIYQDLQNKKNIEKIWLICKFYLMDYGFKSRLKNLNKQKYQFEEVPTLGQKLGS